MSQPEPRRNLAIRAGATPDVGPCLALWVAACAARDGVAISGVAERARPKFAGAESWVVSTDLDGTITGFVVATAPGSGLASDPADAAGVGLLGVDPRAQGRGLGARLLAEVTADLARRGHRRAVLHVLVENDQAVRLYRSQGWRPVGEEFSHTLLKRPTQTYLLDLAP